MTTPYQSSYSNTFPFSDTGAKLQLATSVALSWTVPGSSSTIYRAKFSSSYDAEIWVAINTTATLPSAGTATDTYNQEFLPKYDEARFVKGGDVLSFISSTGTPQVGISLLKVQDIT